MEGKKGKKIPKGTFPNYLGHYMDNLYWSEEEKKMMEFLRGIKQKSPGKNFPKLPPYIFPNSRYEAFLNQARKYMKNHPDYNRNFHE